MNYTKESIFEIIKQACPGTKLTMDSSFANAGLDSMNIASIMLEIEEQYQIQIPDEDVDRLHSVADILEYLKSRKA